MRKGAPEWCVLLRHSFRVKPLNTAVNLGAIPIGLTAALMGDWVSRAFANLGGGPVVRIMGAALCIGGILCLISILRKDPVIEAMGLVLTALGAVLYCIGAFLGLANQGIMSGGMYFLVCIGLLGRVWLLITAGRIAASNDD